MKAKKKYEELWNKIRDLIRSITKNLIDYDEKYIKIKFDSDDNLPLKKTIKLLQSQQLLELFFMKTKKYYPQDFLDECLHKI